jgi:prolyl-tRNA synthetase
VRELLEVVQSSITKRAEKFFKEKLSEARNLKELKRILEEKGGLVRTNWCGKIKCADLIKTKTEGGSIRGTVFGKEEKPFGKCVGCGKEAKEVVYIAKAY